MALFHLSVTQTKRSSGQSAIASAAYRAGERLYSEYYGELVMVSVYSLWKADHHTGQPRRGQDLLCHASCGGLHQPKAFARYGDN